MERLILIGCGGHCRSLIDVVESTGNWKIFGLVGLPGEVGTSVLGYSVLGIDDDLPNIRKHCHYAVVALGQIGTSSQREPIFKKLSQLDFNLPTIVSKLAHVSSHASLASGTIVCHGALINAGATVGLGSIINTNALVEHDAFVGDFTHISTGAIVNGSAHIGKGSFIGSGSIVREGIHLPDYTVISAGKRVMGWPIRQETK